MTMIETKNINLIDLLEMCVMYSKQLTYRKGQRICLVDRAGYLMQCDEDCDECPFLLTNSNLLLKKYKKEKLKLIMEMSNGK